MTLDESAQDIHDSVIKTFKEYQWPMARSAKRNHKLTELCNCEIFKAIRERLLQQDWDRRAEDVKNMCS